MKQWFSKLSPAKLLFVNSKGKIKCIYTPFQVQCISQSREIKPLSIVYVEAVYGTKEGILIYYINKQPHYYWYFIILAKF